MDELDISGKRYISSRRAAKENRYHVDYIGQLIRTGKIIGTKVGRSWYVEEESLAHYLGQTYTPTGEPVAAEVHVPEPVLAEAEAQAEQEAVADAANDADSSVEPGASEDPVPLAEEIEPMEDTEAAARETPRGQPEPEAPHAKVVVEKKPMVEVFAHATTPIAPKPASMGLTYLEDNDPWLPEVNSERKVAIKTQPVAPAVLHGVAAPSAQPRHSSPYVRRQLPGPSLAVSTAVGIIAFAAAFGGSYLLHYTAAVTGQTQAAAVTLGSF